MDSQQLGHVLALWACPLASQSSLWSRAFLRPSWSRCQRCFRVSVSSRMTGRAWRIACSPEGPVRHCPQKSISMPNVQSNFISIASRDPGCAGDTVAASGVPSRPAGSPCAACGGGQNLETSGKAYNLYEAVYAALTAMEHTLPVFAGRRVERSQRSRGTNTLTERVVKG